MYPELLTQMSLALGPHFAVLPVLLPRVGGVPAIVDAPKVNLDAAANHTRCIFPTPAGE